MSTPSWKQEEERKGVQGTRGELLAPDVCDRTQGFVVSRHQIGMGPFTPDLRVRLLWM